MTGVAAVAIELENEDAEGLVPGKRGWKSNLVCYGDTDADRRSVVGRSVASGWPAAANPGLPVVVKGIALSRTAASRFGTRPLCPTSRSPGCESIPAPLLPAW